jgi:hypothetical protein
MFIDFSFFLLLKPEHTMSGGHCPPLKTLVERTRWAVPALQRLKPEQGM